MTMSRRDRQIAEAEELLADRLHSIEFAKGLFFGQYLGDKLRPFPDFDADVRTCELVEQLETFCRSHVDPDKIDRNQEIPKSVIDGLGQLGILGACLPTSCGGLGLSQSSYCRLLEVLGAH